MEMMKGEEWRWKRGGEDGDSEAGGGGESE